MDVFSEEYKEVLDDQMMQISEALGLPKTVVKELEFTPMNYQNTIMALDNAIALLIDDNEATTYVLIKLRDSLK